MKLIIKKVGDSWGERYYLYRTYLFGLIKVPFREVKRYSDGTLGKNLMAYYGLGAAQTSARNYMSCNTITYKGFILRRAVDNNWFSHSYSYYDAVRNLSCCVVYGSLENCKMIIDQRLEEEYRRKHPTYIKVD